MPQLDLFSWLNQVFTTTIVMLVFYMVLTLIFLPTTTAILKGRTKLQSLRVLSYNVLNKQVTVYVSDTFLRLATILTNDLVYIWAFFSPSITNQFKMDIDLVCYEAALEHIEELVLNNSLIGVLPLVMVEDASGNVPVEGDADMGGASYKESGFSLSIKKVSPDDSSYCEELESCDYGEDPVDDCWEVRDRTKERIKIKNSSLLKAVFTEISRMTVFVYQDTLEIHFFSTYHTESFIFLHAPHLDGMSIVELFEFIRDKNKLGHFKWAVTYMYRNQQGGINVINELEFLSIGFYMSELVTRCSSNVEYVPNVQYVLPVSFK